MEQHSDFMLQSHWHRAGLTLGCPLMASLVETPSGQNVYRTTGERRSWCQLHIILMHSLSFLLCSICSRFIIFWLIPFLSSPPFSSPHRLRARVCAHVIFEDSSWTDHCAPFFLQSLSPSRLSLRLSPSLSGRLQRNWSLGGSREEPGKGGTKGRPSAAITTPHLLCASPPPPPLLSFPPSVPSLSSLSPLASAPN